MTKKIIKIIFITLLIMTIFIGLNSCNYEIYGANPSGEEESSMPIDVDWYKPASTDNVPNASKLQGIGNSIIGFLQIIGSIASVVVLAVIGIKYMLGSAEERAGYKKTMGPYVLGAVMVFAITNIVSLVAKLAQTLL